MAKKIRFFTATAIVAAVAIAVLIGLKGPDQKAVAADIPVAEALTVSEAAVTSAVWPEVISASGSIVAWQEAVVAAEISGQKLVAVMADVGDVVKKGQVLAQYNREMLDAEYAELKANWVAAAANQTRAMKLKESGAISDKSIENFINLAAVAKAQMDAKSLQLKYTDVVAPDDGVISTRTAMLGAVGGTGDELFRLIRRGRLEWHGELTPLQVAGAAPGQSVILSLPNGQEAQGSIRQVAPVFDAETRMTMVFVDIEGGAAAQAGMYATGDIRTGEKRMLSVPAKSVVIRDGKNYVFSINNDIPGKESVEQREVRTGRTQGDKTQILSGVEEGTRIVLKGAGFLNDGDIVRVLPGQGGDDDAGS